MSVPCRTRARPQRGPTPELRRPRRRLRRRVRRGVWPYGAPARAPPRWCAATRSARTAPSSGRPTATPPTANRSPPSTPACGDPEARTTAPTTGGPHRVRLRVQVRRRPRESGIAAQRQSTSLWADAQVKGILAFGRTIEVENLSASCASTGTGIRSEVRMGRNHFGNSVAGEGVIPAPERITFDGGSAVVNEQQVRASDGTLTVNALHITMNSGPSFILGSVTCTRLA
ncbi:choice-of-anchor P family protein [Streptosporangium jomthongense]|uniref:Choice-of-anchor P family protein n=1 Tax=Streptosporangium jomthongense TaxID=1193683 RepID=A0ABV8F6J2_9ACTN